MSADLLRRAAKVLRDPLRCNGNPEQDQRTADLLDTHAEVAESNDEHDGFDLEAIDDTHVAAVNLARAILREEQP